MNWRFLTPDSQLVNRLQKQFKSSEIIAKVIANRGIESINNSHSFFKPDLQQLHNPFLMRDMEKAVERIVINISGKKPIFVFGDYDVDGTTGAAMLYLSLQALKANVTTYIPNREKEGYGLSETGIEKAKEIGADLIITCDCGINAFEKVKFATQLGIDVIITDHHIPDDKLPDAYAVLNPKRTDCEYPFKELCGGGVAFKLVSALAQKLDKTIDSIYSNLDLIAFGTCADVVPLKDENRIIVRHGLQLMENTKRPGLKALLNSVGLGDKSINVGQLVFGVAPKINAAGRLGDANRSVELLTTNDAKCAKALTNELLEENKRRQLIQQNVVDDALNLIHSKIDLKNDRAIVLAEHDWHPGVIGIVASKVKEEFNRPTVIISYDKNGIGKGSARSIPGLDLYKALSAASEHLIDFGGHSMAAGLTLEKKDFPAFIKVFTDYVNKTISTDDLIPSITLDGEIKLKDINGRFMDFLDKLAPYGPGNMRPKFAAFGVDIVGNPRVIGNGDHLRFKVRQHQRIMTAIGFNMSKHYEKLIKGFPIDLAFVVETNEWQGRKTVQLNIRDIKLGNKGES